MLVYYESLIPKVVHIKVLHSQFPIPILDILSPFLGEICCQFVSGDSPLHLAAEARDGPWGRLNKLRGSGGFL